MISFLSNEPFNKYEYVVPVIEMIFLINFTIKRYAFDSDRHGNASKNPIR